MEKLIYMIINILDYLSLTIVVIALISLICVIIFEKGRPFSNILFSEKARKIRYILGSLFINLYLLGMIFTLISFVLYRTPRINDVIVKVIVTILTLFFFKDYKWNIIKFVKVVKAWIVNKKGEKNEKKTFK